MPAAQKTRVIGQGDAVHIVNKYYKRKGVVKCPICEKETDTMIISRGLVCCPYCQKLNWLDLISLIGKTPEGVKSTFVVACHYKDKVHKENNTVIVGPRTSWFWWIINKLTFGLIKSRVKFGYMKIYVSPTVLKNAVEFDKKYLVVLGAAQKELIVKYFGDVQATVTEEVKRYKEQ